MLIYTKWIPREFKLLNHIWGDYFKWAFFDSPNVCPFLLKINMVKTSEKGTKDPKRQERDKKSHETYMKGLKEKNTRR